MPSFTVAVRDLRDEGAILPVRIGVSADAEAALRRTGQPVPPPQEVRALIDIGAGRSLIQRGLAARLRLTPVGLVEIDTPSSTDLEAPEYRVRFWLNHNLGLEVTALEAPLPGDRLGALLGRDLLAQAKFEYDGPRSRFRLTVPRSAASSSSR
ncbi:MAG: hypothetical protein L3K15_01810 [Thermoplasmata archaeon]|nr:hypothetical protein [Thermoplasmata archaeon]